MEEGAERIQESTAGEMCSQTMFFELEISVVFMNSVQLWLSAHSWPGQHLLMGGEGPSWGTIGNQWLPGDVMSLSPVA